MNVLCVGLNWRTPVSVRERLAFDRTVVPHALTTLHDSFEGAEFTILSTCNRTELYAAANEQLIVEADDLGRFLSDYRDVSLDEFYPHLYLLQGKEAASHLFRVCSGLDSLVLGEGQILAQVKEAYQHSVDAKTTGAVLHALFQRAFFVAKRVQTETGLAKGRLSIASAAVDYIKGVFEVFNDKTVLVVGAGKMAELTIKHLQELHPARLILTNRSPERAEQLAAKHGGASWPYERLHEAIVEADIVVSSTAADEPIVLASQFIEIMKRRKQRLIAVVDIAVPRDFDVAIGDLANVLLWNIDDLEKVRNQTIRSRKKELESANEIVAEETEKFAGALAAIRSGPIISQLEQEYKRIIDDELARLLPQLNGMTEEQRGKIEQFAHRIKNKLLHPPKVAIREHVEQGHHGLLETVQRLFGLHKNP